MVSKRLGEAMADVCAIKASPGHVHARTGVQSCYERGPDSQSNHISAASIFLCFCLVLFLYLFRAFLTYVVIPLAVFRRVHDVDR